MKILFVCRGNVGRSQMAEAVFKRLTEGDGHEARSAGTKVLSKEGESQHGQLLKDLPGAENVITSIKETGSDVSENARTQLDPTMVDWADIIVTMAEPETVPPYLSNSPKTVYWEVEDPKGTPLEVHRATLEEIEDLVKDFIVEYSL